MVVICSAQRPNVVLLSGGRLPDQMARSWTKAYIGFVEQGNARCSPGLHAAISFVHVGCAKGDAGRGTTKHNASQEVVNKSFGVQ